MDLTITAAKVDGRMVTFDLLAYEGAAEISRGSHSRFIVEVEKLRRKIAAKVDTTRVRHSG